MDINKDGQLDKNDLRGAFDNVGVLMSESELDGLLGEISGPCTGDMDVKIDSKMFEHALKTWGDKMTKAEIDDIFGEFEIDEDYMIKPKAEEPAPVEEAPEAEPEEDADAKKKKKKKKKA